jgi:LacI family transcriptional regulator
LELRERPTAMIINADESACAFLNMVQRAGIQVPQELSVVSIDDTPMALYASVALTSASQPCLQHAEKAAELLLERINGTYSGPPRTIWVEGDFKPRDSTAPPPK